MNNLFQNIYNNINKIYTLDKVLWASNTHDDIKKYVYTVTGTDIEESKVLALDFNNMYIYVINTNDIDIDDTFIVSNKLAKIITISDDIYDPDSREYIISKLNKLFSEAINCYFKSSNDYPMTTISYVLMYAVPILSAHTFINNFAVLKNNLNDFFGDNYDSNDKRANIIRDSLSYTINELFDYAAILNIMHNY